MASTYTPFEETGVNHCSPFWWVTYLRMVVGIGASMLSLQM